MFRQIIQLSRPVTQVLIVLFLTILSQLFLGVLTFNLPTTTEFNFLRLVLSHIMLFIMPALVLLRGRGEFPESAWRLKPSGDYRFWVVAIFTLPLLLGVFFWLEELVVNWENPWTWWERMRATASEDTLLSDMIEGSPFMALFAFLSVCILAPISEELYFRGTIQRVLSTAMPGWLSILFTSFLFTRLHSNIDQYPIIFLSSLFLGIMYHRSQSIWMNIVAHMVFNGLSFCMAIGWFEFEMSTIVTSISALGAVALVFFSPKLPPTQAQPDEALSSSDTTE